MNDKEILQHAFATSPDTVYGLLIALMCIAVGGLWAVGVWKDKKLLELNISTIEALKDVVATLVAIKEAGINQSTNLKEAIETSRERIEEQIRTLENEIKK